MTLLDLRQLMTGQDSLARSSCLKRKMLCTRVKLNTDHDDTSAATPGDGVANDTLEDMANDAGAENNLKCCHEIGLDE